MVVRVVTPFSVVVGYQRFRGPCCLHLQGQVHFDLNLLCRDIPKSHSSLDEFGTCHDFVVCNNK
jgi:hypothetical protein